MQTAYELLTAGKSDLARFLRTGMSLDELPEKFRARLQQNRQEREKHEAEQHQIEFERRFKRSAIPTKYNKDIITKLQTKGQAQAALKEQLITYLKEHYHKNGSLLVFGDKGTGKSHAVFSMLVYMMRRGKTAMYYNASELIRKIDYASRNFKSEESPENIINDLSMVSMLMIDEFAEKPQKQSYGGNLFESDGNIKQADIIRDIIDARYRNEKPTILISNRELRDIEMLLAPPYLERLTGEAGMTIEVRGPSLR